MSTFLYCPDWELPEDPDYGLEIWDLRDNNLCEHFRPGTDEPIVYTDGRLAALDRVRCRTHNRQPYLLHVDDNDEDPDYSELEDYMADKLRDLEFVRCDYCNCWFNDTTAITHWRAGGHPNDFFDILEDTAFDWARDLVNDINDGEIERIVIAPAPRQRTTARIPRIETTTHHRFGKLDPVVPADVAF